METMVNAEMGLIFTLNKLQATSATASVILSHPSGIVRMSPFLSAPIS